MKKRIFYILLILGLNLYSMNYENKLPHLNTIISIYQNEELALTNSFISISKDGFIKKWNKDFVNIHFQISNKKINLCTFNPHKTEVAIYETDDNNRHEISVWDYTTLEKKYSSIYEESILSLEYSKNGTYLIIGTTGEDGLIFLDSISGREKKKITENFRMISNFETSSSEKTFFAYSMAGNFLYYNLTTNKLLKKIKTQIGLENVTLFFNNRYVAAKYNKSIFIYDAISGEKIYSKNCINPMLFKYNDEIFYLDYSSSKVITINKIIINNNESVNSVIYKNININKNEQFTSTLFTKENIFLGTNSGNIYYTVKDEATSNQCDLLTNEKNQIIYDALYIEDDLFILTNKQISKTNENKDSLISLIPNTNYTRFSKFNDKIILWSQQKNASVAMFDPKDNSIVELFKSNGYIQNLKKCNNLLIEIENRSVVNYYDFEKKSLVELYYGSGIHDVVIIEDDYMYIAKSGYDDSVLLCVNIKTRETVNKAINLKSIQFIDLQINTGETNQDSQNNNKNIIYGIAINNKNENCIFTYDDNNSKTKILASSNSSNDNLILYVINNHIFTNIDSYNIISLNANKKTQISYERNNSLPVKIQGNADNIITINYDGSLTWYDYISKEIIATWYIKDDGSIIELN